jgi:hypothetical protein
VAAGDVWKALGATGKFGYDFNTTLPHCQASPSHMQTVNAFVTQFLQDGNANTNVANPPNAAGFDLNTARAIDWQTPTLQ